MPFGVWIFFLRSGETTFRIFFFLPNSIHVREKGNCCLEKPEAKFANEIKILINYCNIYLKGFIFITYLTNRCFPWCKNTLIFFSFHTSTNCFCVIYCTVGYLPRELMQSLIIAPCPSVAHLVWNCVSLCCDTSFLSHWPALAIHACSALCPFPPVWLPVFCTCDIHEQ